MRKPASDKPAPVRGSGDRRPAKGGRLVRSPRRMLALCGISAGIGFLAFWLMSDSVGDWFRQYREFGDTDPRGMEAAEAIKALGDEAVPFLYGRMLVEPGASKLTEFWSWVGTCLPATLRGLVSQKSLPDPRECALELLQQNRPSAAALMDILAKPLSDPQHERHLLALLLLRTAGDGAPRVVPYLSSALLSTNENWTGCAASSVAALGPSAEGAVPALIETIRRGTSRLGLAVNAYEAIRLTIAVGALQAIGPSAEAAVPLLEEVVRNGKPEELRDQARMALCCIRPSHPELQTFIRRLDGDDSAGRSNAFQRLGEIGPPAQAALPALLAAIGEDDAETEDMALQTLLRIDPDNRQAAALLIRRLTASDDSRRTEQDRLRWAQWLALMEPPEPAGIEALAHIVRSGRGSHSRIHAMSVLFHLGDRAAAAKPALKAACKDSDPDVKAAAASALARIDR
jgi:hypothetical protein